MKPAKTALLKKSSTTFRKLTSLTIEKFDELVRELSPLYNEAEAKRLHRLNRHRAQGGGRKSQLSLEDRLIMVLLYYNFYITLKFLGFIFSLHESNVSRNVNYFKPLLKKLLRIPTNRISLSEAGITKDQLLALFTAAAERRIVGRSHQKQRNSFSVNKRRQPVKNQFVEKDRIEIFTISQSNHILTHDEKQNVTTSKYVY